MGEQKRRGQAQVTYRIGDPLWECVYCGSKGPILTDEHIVPQGLGGKKYLAKASCEVCQEITKKFENKALQGSIMWPMRTALGLGNKGKPKKIMKMYGSAQWGRPYVVETHVDNIPMKAALPFWLNRPKILIGGDRPMGKTQNINLWELIDDEANKHAAYNFGPGSQGLEIPIRAYAQMLAKIAHCACVAHYGLRSFQPILIDIILRRARDWEFFIGNSPKPFSDHKNFNVCAFTTSHTYTGLLIVYITIFPSQGSPTYEIVVGRLFKVPTLDSFLSVSLGTTFHSSAFGYQ